MIKRIKKFFIKKCNKCDEALNKIESKLKYDKNNSLDRSFLKNLKTILKEGNNE